MTNVHNQPILPDYSPEELINAMLQYVSNRKNEDKFGINYKIGMIDHWQGMYSQHLKRNEMIDRFKSLLNEQTIYKCIQSQYTENQLLKYLPKR